MGGMTGFGLLAVMAGLVTLEELVLEPDRAGFAAASAGFPVGSAAAVAELTPKGASNSAKRTSHAHALARARVPAMSSLPAMARTFGSLLRA
jgi:hypothetical protein